MSQTNSVILVSGGLDSCVTAANAIEIDTNVAFLHMNYGQITEERELKAFHDIADFYNIKKRLVIDGRFLKEIGGSSLTDRKVKMDLDSIGKIPNTYVPFRNGIILSIATAYAEVLGAKRLYIGAVWEDSSGYPDCRPEFFKAFNSIIETGTRDDTDLQIFTPLINMSKQQIVEEGIRREAPLHLTWSCYRESKIACGECESCRLRLKGFKLAGLEDPIEYK